MFNNLKISTSITVRIAVVVGLSILSLFGISNHRTSETMKASAIDTMKTDLKAREALLNRFVTNVEASMLTFSHSNEIYELLKDPDNEEKQKAAQLYTEAFSTDLVDWGSLYIANWDTKVLAHSDAGSVGMVTRTGDSLTSLRNDISASGKLYNAGIMISPADGKQYMSLYCPMELEYK